MSGDERAILTFHHSDFNAEDLVHRKQGRTLSVVVPARDEERTVGRVVSAVRDGLIEHVGLVDELVVVDDGSYDATAQAAATAGARVVRSVERSDESGKPIGLGKGGAMARGLEETSGDLVVFLDADVANLRAHFVTGLVGPLLISEQTLLVKSLYDPAPHGDASGGGRVTELVARPALSLLFPEIAGIEQPIAGETAVRRSALEGVELDPGYAAEMGMLIDVAQRFGAAALAQVDIGVRVHRRRPLTQLAPQAHAVLAAALRRAGVTVS